MSESEKKKFTKRSPEIHKTYQPPYTSLRAQESEKLTTKTKDFTIKAIPEEELVKKTEAQIAESIRTGADFSLYDPTVLANDLRNISRQVLSEEKKAELELEAQEKADAAATTEQLKQDLKQWKKDSIKDLDTQIENALAEQGITKEMLRNNAKLRKQVTEWKRKSVADFKKELTTKESEAITKQQEALAQYQKEQREQFKENIEEYEEKVRQNIKSDVLATQERIKADTISQQEKLMADAGWKGSWDDYVENVKAKEDLFKQLESAGVVTLVTENGKTTATLARSPTTLTDREVDLLAKAGFDVSQIPAKGPSGYVYDVVAQGGIVGMLTGQQSRALFPQEIVQRQKAEWTAGMLGDFTEGLTSIYNLVASVTPLPELAFRGPTTGTLQYYDKYLTPDQIKIMQIGGIGAYALGSYLSLIPVGYTVKGITAVAKGAAIRLSETGLAQTVAKNLGIAVSKVPRSQLTSKLATKIGELMKSRKIQQAMVWTSLGGGEAYNVVVQLSTGQPIDEILLREGRNVAGMIAGTKGFQAGWQAGEGLSKKIVSRMTKNQWDKFSRSIQWTESTGADGTTAIYAEADMKDIPRQVRDLMKIEHNPATGKEKILSFRFIGNNAAGEPIWQPEISEFKEYQKVIEKLLRGESFAAEGVKSAVAKIVGKDKLETLSALGYDFSHMEPDRILAAITREYGDDVLRMSYDKALENLKLAKTIQNATNMQIVEETLTKIIGKDKYRLLIEKGYDVYKMRPDQITTLMYKELGWNTPWEEVIEKLNQGTLEMYPIKGKPTIRVPIGTTTGEFVTKTPRDVSKLYNELRGMGIFADDAAKLTSDLLTKPSKEVISNINVLIKKGYDTQKLVELSLKYNPAGSNTVTDILKSAGLNQSQISTVIQASAIAGDNAQLFASQVKTMGAKAGAQALQLISRDELAKSLYYLDVKPLSGVVSVEPSLISKISDIVPAAVTVEILNTAAARSVSNIAAYIPTAIIPDVLPKLNAASLSHLMVDITPESLNKILLHLSPTDWTNMGAKLTLSALSKVVPNLTPEQFNGLIPALTPDQLSNLLPRVTPDQLNSVLESLDLPPDVVPQYLQMGIVPNVQNISPMMLKKLIEERIKRNKKADDEEKSTYFQVTLLHTVSSETFKVEARTFKEATHKALQRRKVKQIPNEVLVRKLS